MRPRSVTLESGYQQEEAEGYEVATAADGREALTYLGKTESMPSLILLDLIMPGMDGRTFLSQRDADARLSSIPVVLVSCQVDASKTATELGLAGTIRKPIGIRNLVKAIHKHPS